MLKGLRCLAAAALVVGLGSAVAPAASARTIAALSGDTTLILINLEARRVVRTVNVNVGSRILGIDVRPANNTLYGLTAAGGIITINPRTGAATQADTLDLAVPSGTVSVDVNPVADAIRIIGSGGANLRYPFATGTAVADTAINFLAPNPFGGTTPSVAAAAYTNSAFPAVGATQLIDIDTSTNALYLQFPPNNGTLVPLGRITASSLGSSFGFDIQFDSRRGNEGYIITNNRLLRIDLVGGVIIGNARIRGLNAAVRDIAFLP